MLGTADQCYCHCDAGPKERKWESSWGNSMHQLFNKPADLLMHQPAPYVPSFPLLGAARPLQMVSVFAIHNFVSYCSSLCWTWEWSGSTASAAFLYLRFSQGQAALSQLSRREGHQISQHQLRADEWHLAQCRWFQKCETENAPAQASCLLTDREIWSTKEPEHKIKRQVSSGGEQIAPSWASCDSNTLIKGWKRMSFQQTPEW